jgi:hypothetical protein
MRLSGTSPAQPITRPLPVYTLSFSLLHSGAFTGAVYRHRIKRSAVAARTTMDALFASGRDAVPNVG